MTGCTKGCPIGNLALELADDHPAARALIDQNFRNWTRGVADWLRSAGDRLPRDVDRDALAQLVLTIMEGGLMQGAGGGWHRTIRRRGCPTSRLLQAAGRTRHRRREDVNQIMLLAVLCALTIAGVSHAGDRVLRHEAIIDAPVTDVWRAWTTDAGITSWMVPHGTVDLRVGGAMRTSYDPTADLDGDAAIVNRILAYEPERMLAMQNVQAPPGFKHVELFRDTWSVVRFEPIGAMRTRLIVSGYGYGEGEEWDELYGFFDQGNAYLMSQLQKVFTPEDVERDSSGAAVLAAQCARWSAVAGGCATNRRTAASCVRSSPCGR
jgi:uncharacterized protein YndB with AHSA1/START domain